MSIFKPSAVYSCKCSPPGIDSNLLQNLMFIGPCIIVIVEEQKTNLMSFAVLFHFLCAQHISVINISIIRSLRLFCWITTLVVLFLVRCVLEFRCGWVGVVSVLQASASRKLLMMDILMAEICWAHKKWNKIASDIKLVFYSSNLLQKFSYSSSSSLFIPNLSLAAFCRILRQTFHEIHILISCSAYSVISLATTYVDPQ